KGRPFPHAPGDELEWPRRDLLARRRDADDHGGAPAAMAAFERLAHGVGVADAFETVVGTAVRQFDEMGDEIALYLLRIDEMGEPEFARERLALWIHVDADDPVGAR